MINKIKTRMASEEGFTLIELLVVMIILGILVAIAVPAYLSLTSKAKTAAAEANVRSAIPAAETYMEQSATTTYRSISPSGLIGVAPGVKVTDAVALNGNAAYCIDDTEGTTSYNYIGGDTSVSPGVTFNAGFVAGKVQPGLCADATA